jgi:hypothetical protein
MSKLRESFKSSDFDTDYFVAEALKSDKVNQVVVQLKQALESVENELRTVVKQSSDIILSAANNTDVAIGDLLTLREHLGPIKDALERINHEEQDSLAGIKEVHANLKRAIEVSGFVKKVAKVATEVSKLKAQFPDLTRETPDRETLLSLVSVEELAILRKVEIIKDEIMWLEASFERTGLIRQTSPEKRRT